MKRFFLPVLLLACALASAGASTLKISADSATRAGSEVEANYSTSHLYLDETTGGSIPITVFFDPQTLGVESAEVLTNLNRRERADDDANGDGVQDGIKPPNANNIPAGNDAHYFKAYTMAGVSGGYQLTLQAQKTGAYRLTARYRLNGDAPGTYRYYNDEIAGGLNKRDHCVVVSPRTARDISLYEVNPLTIIATGTLASQRGTFADLANGVAGGPRFSLQYVRDLGCNMLWFQPVHPNGIDGRQIDPTTGQPFEVGSPYAVKNFFEIMPLMAKAFVPGGSPAANDTPAGRAQAMGEFQAFASAADAAGVGIMLDAPFNHTSYDCELGAAGNALFGGSATTEWRNFEARFYSRTDAYDMRASGSGNIAVAPDRYDFGKFGDTKEIFFGRYAALVPNAGQSGNYLNEGDWFDYSVGNENSAGDGNGHFDSITQRVWRYFAEYLQFWLTQTGYPANAAGASLASEVGIDALRADFGQGLPPQSWEYIINRTRTRKWNFVFMAESLDGGPVTYRSGRHFDILNENIVFPLHAATSVSAYRAIYDARRNAYGQALVLLNSSSHDEDHYNDPFEALIRYAVNSTIDGVPLIFPGQELGLSGTVIPPNDTNGGITPFGYDRYETNFGKPIPHFKKYNSLMPLWLKTQPGHASFNYGLAQLAPVFSAVGQARQFSAALRSSNRYYLNLTDSTIHGQIFSIAKFAQRNASPATSDVVLAFVNIDRNNNAETTGGVRFNVAIDADGNGANDFGIKSARRYNVRNLAAYLGVDPTRRDALLIPGGKLGSELTSDGLYVKLNKVPTSDGAWATAPYEAQFLKLYDVTAPVLTPGQPAGPNPFAYEIGSSVVFTWAGVAADGEGVVPKYRVIVTINGNAQPAVVTSATSVTVAGLNAGDHVSAVVAAVNPDDTGAAGPSSTASATIQMLAATADEDGDGTSNADEMLAATNPLSSASVFRVTSITRLSPTTVRLTWNSVPAKSYEILSSPSLTAPFTPIAGSQTTASSPSTSYDDTAANGAPKYYKVRVLP
jgi:glycosidase